MKLLETILFDKEFAPVERDLETAFFYTVLLS